VELRRRIGDPAGLGITLGLLGEVAMAAADFDVAQLAYAECLGLMRRAGSRHGVLALVHSMAELAALRGDDAEAMALADEAAPLADELGDRLHMALLDQVRGHVMLRRGDAAGACRLLVDAVEQLWLQQAAELLLQTLDVLLAALTELPAADDGEVWVLSTALDSLRDELGWPRPPAYEPLAESTLAALRPRVGAAASTLSVRASTLDLTQLVDRSLAAANADPGPAEAGRLH
jgi:hypothetical protein